MPTLTLTFDTGSVPLARIYDAVADEYGYQPMLINPDGTSAPNPENKAQFFRRTLGTVLANTVRASERRAARAKADAEVPPVTLT